MNTPLVSICCITYNHAPFIRQCLDGFLMQKGVDYEILIHDDCSTDGTTEIVKEYAAKYPDIIFPLYETENQYSNPQRTICMDNFNIERARGKYLAFCEGDDYWTDPLKLQKQIDFMEQRLDCSATVHRYQKYYRSQNQYEEDLCGRFFADKKENIVELSLQDFYSSWITQFLTLVCRRDCYDIAEMNTYAHCCDSVQIYNLFLKGRVFLMSFVGGVYNISGEGTYTELTQIEQLKHSLGMYQEIAQHHPEDRLAKRMCANLMQEILYRHGEKSFADKCKLALDIWQSNRKYKQLLHNIVRK